MATKVKLEIDELADFESSSIWCRLRTTTRQSLRGLPHVYEHSVAALRFCQQIGSPHAVSEEDRDIMKVAYLRAALMEFVAMEEVLPVDLERRSLNENPLRIKSTGSAHLIILRELRHLHLHLATKTFEEQQRDAVLRFGEKEINTTLSIELIPYEDLLKLKDLRNANMYDSDELDAAITWLNKAQSNWGIGDVLQKGVQKYADALVSVYKLQP
jgi:hypothetical protein